MSENMMRRAIVCWMIITSPCCFYTILGVSARVAPWWNECWPEREDVREEEDVDIQREKSAPTVFADPTADSSRSRGAGQRNGPR